MNFQQQQNEQALGLCFFLLNHSKTLPVNMIVAFYSRCVFLVLRVCTHRTYIFYSIAVWTRGHSFLVFCIAIFLHFLFCVFAVLPLV